ncbi:MAG: pyridoxal phosphate-dependent aminotransferase [Saprospiraceae bacterium]|nr:pyridoxal phosphate-dependent aminotransferase [Saprospiraceae bacterium]MCB0624833.1 pyridoxal phosphate-dependent aminotransferase [Saprospiraceae bacterium]MCB0678284.1 pyridoxal phosphate-dependent aminotransferase [Saprospiraceae bacterium]MCB0680072.1 pyridoxal phosphate-dependent aminotransferase [Saprospiraceae bacterium]
MSIDLVSLLSERVLQMEESATIKMAQLARDLKAEGHDVISLSLGEPDFDTPEHIKEAAKQALDEGYTKYTPVPGLPELREAIVRKFRRDNGLEFDVNQIVVSNGAKQTIANLCLALLNEGDEVVVFAPYWVSYVEIIRLAGGVPVIVGAGIDHDFKVSPEQVAAAITGRTKFVLFSSPCNPTGSVYSADELTAIAEVIAPHEQVHIVSDEIYEYINFTGRHASIGAHPAVKDRTITVNGFAKGFAMTGWRLGYMGGPTQIAAACAKIQGQFTSGASSFGQKAAAVALDSDLTPTYRMREAFLKRRNLVLELLSKVPGFKVNDPQGAFYVFPDVSEHFGKAFRGEIIKDADDFCIFLLHQAHVAAVSGAAFGAEQCIRISYAASEEQLRTAIERIADAVSELQ